MTKKETKSSSNNDYLVEEVKQLNEKLTQVQTYNNRLLEIIKDNELEDELDEIVESSVEESICLNGLNHLSSLFENGVFSKDDVQAFDILHKNYRLIKGFLDANKKPKKVKKENVGELMSIVRDIKESKK